MIVIIDYGMGNLFSVQAAIHYLGAESVISTDLDVISSATKLVLPGVGSFHKAMETLKAYNLVETIKNSVNLKGTPVLGICLGMQLLGLSGTEDGFTEGFGFIDSPVERFDDKSCNNLKIPHVGFDTVLVTGKNNLFEGLDSQADFYFTHSYRISYCGQYYTAGVCSHGESFIAAFEKDNICGTQFHPEKSQTNGLILLKNFLSRF